MVLFIKNFLTIEHVPRITDFCICIYVFRCKLSLVRLCDSDFGIIPVDDITIRITWAAFCFHIAYISFASSWYLFCLSVIVLVRLCVFGTAMSIKKVFFVFLFITIMPGQLKGVVLSISMLRFQYSLKFIIIIIIIIIMCPCHNWSLNLFYENMLWHLRVGIWHLSIIQVLNINITVFEVLGLFLSSGRNDMKRVTFCSAARYMCCRI